MRLIDADKLKEDINSRFLRDSEKRLLCQQIDKAPTEFDDKAYSQGYANGTCDTEHASKSSICNWYDCIPNCLKARHGEYVVYKIDYLLDNLAREIYLLKGTRMKGDTDRG